MKWLEALRSPSRLDTQILHCAPLVVVHPEDGVVYARDTDVEFEPTSLRGDSGHAVALTPDAMGLRPSLAVEDRMEKRTGLDPYDGRAWVVLIGSDDEGEPFSWYIDGAADEYLVSHTEAIED